MNDLPSLMKMLIEHYNVRSYTELATIIDYNSRTIQRYVKGSSTPKIDFYKKLEKKFPSLDIKAFMNGEFIISSDKQILEDPKNKYSTSIEEVNIDYRKKYYDLLEKYTNCLEEKVFLNKTLLSHERLIATGKLK